MTVIRVSHWSIFCSLIFVSSCIDVDKTLGDNLIPIDQDLTLQSVVFDLPISSIPSDSLPTNSFFSPGQGYELQFGSCLDPLFGLVEAGSVFQFAPNHPYDSLPNYTYGEDLKPVSLTLYMARGSAPTILDKSQAYIPQNLYVHEILSDLSAADAYNNSLRADQWNPIPLSLPGQLYFGTDTATVSLSLDFARELLQADQTERDSTAAFIKRYKGLYLRTEKATAPFSGRLNQSDYFYMVLKYTASGADSTLYYFPYSGYNCNTIAHSGAILDPHPADNIYFQGLAGPKPYIDFVSLVGNIREWAQQQQISVEKLLLTNAEVVLSYSPSVHYEIVNQYPSTLALCTHTHLDSLAYYKFIDDTFFEYAGGAINRSKFQYSFTITHYLQSLLKKDQVIPEDNTWLMQVETVEDVYGSVTTYVNNHSYPLAVFEGTATDSKPIIKISYAVLK